MQPCVMLYVPPLHVDALCKVALCYQSAATSMSWGDILHNWTIAVSPDPISVRESLACETTLQPHDTIQKVHDFVQSDASPPMSAQIFFSAGHVTFSQSDPSNRSHDCHIWLALLA